MTLSPDEHKLLTLISQAGKPVAASDYFHQIHPPTFDSSTPDDDPVREAWAEKQIGMYGAYLRLHEAGLVRIVHPANGERPDLIEPTDTGRAASPDSNATPRTHNRAGASRVAQACVTPRAACG